MRRRQAKEPEYNGKTYNQWVNAYNKGEANYEDYLIARKVLVEGIDEEKAVEEVQSVRTGEREETTEEDRDNADKW